MESIGYTAANGSGYLELPLPQNVSPGDLIVVHGTGQSDWDIMRSAVAADGRFERISNNALHQGYPDFTTWAWRVPNDPDLSPLPFGNGSSCIGVAIGYRDASPPSYNSSTHSSSGIPRTPDMGGQSTGFGATLTRSGDATVPSGWIYDGETVSGYILKFIAYHKEGSLAPSVFTETAASWRTRVWLAREEGGWVVGAVACS